VIKKYQNMTVKTFTFSPFQENTYLIYDETKEAVLIDAGCFNEREQHQLKNFIVENNLILKRLINTHLHLDHQFGNKYVTETFGLKPEAGKDDEFLIENFTFQAQKFGLAVPGSPQELGGYIEDNQELKFGNSILKALHVPGHSPGSMAFYAEKEGVLFAGDVLFNGSIGRTDLERGDYATLIRSIQNRLLPLPDSTTVYCGHGPTTTIGNERVNNPYL
jgi:hydroxyacylglutathione hydrolase